MKRVLRCTDPADDAHQNLVQWSLAVRLFRDECDTNLNCSRTAPWDHWLPQRADLEHWCLVLKLLSKKAHHRSIFSTIWPSIDDDERYRFFVTLFCFCVVVFCWHVATNKVKTYHENIAPVWSGTYIYMRRDTIWIVLWIKYKIFHQWLHTYFPKLDEKFEHLWLSHVQHR